MKKTYKLILSIAVLAITFSCAKEEMIEPDPGLILTFQRDGYSSAFAGTTFYVIPTGKGEFFTLYNGKKSHVWGEEGATGTDFDGSDSLGVEYSDAGTYYLTLVVSSAGDCANDYSQVYNTVEINVVDQRNSFESFFINDEECSINSSNEISISLADVITDFNFAPEFKLDSDEAIAYVDGVEQVSGETINDFSNSVEYVVKSAENTEQIYTVVVSTYESSDAKKLTSFVLGKGGYDEIAVIDDDLKTIKLKANYGTEIDNVRLELESSYGSEIYINDELYSDRTYYNMLITNTLTVVAQDKSSISYTIETEIENPVTSFTFPELNPEPEGIIDTENKTITLTVIKETDITQLIASWTGSLGDVTVESVNQSNGVTKNDFTNPVTYTFYKGDSEGDQYIVTVNYAN